MGNTFYKRLALIIEKDPRYKPDAYEFVMQGLWHTQKKLKKPGHVSGRELAEGIRQYALQEYGPLAKAVFDHWGVKCTADFGEMVFLMVEQGIMGKTDDDTRDDFKDVYDFEEAFDVYRSGKLDLKS